MNPARLLGNAARQALATLATLIFSLAASAITARYLGPAALGLLGVALWTRFTLLLLLDVGIGSAISKFLSELSGSGDLSTANAVVRTLTRIQIALAAVAGVAFSLASGVVSQVVGQPELASLLPIVGLGLTLTLINGALVGRLVGLQEFGFKTTLDALIAAASLLGVVLIVRLGLGIRELLWMDVAIAALQGGILVTRPGVRKPAISIGHIDGQLARRILNYCAGVFLVTTFDSILWQRSEVFFLSRFTTTSEVAFYNVAYSLAVIPVTLIPFSIATVLFPFLSEQFGSSGRLILGLISARTIKFCGLVCFPVGAVLMALANPLVRIIYGEAFESAAGPLRVLLVGAVAGSLAVPGANIFLAVGRPGIRAIWGVPTAILSLALAFVLVPPFGALGAALAKGVSQLLHVVLEGIYLRQAQDLRLPYGELARALGVSVPIGVAGYLCTVWMNPIESIVVTCCLCAAGYIPLVLWARVLNEADFDLLLDLVRSGPARLQPILVPTITRARRFAGIQA